MFELEAKSIYDFAQEAGIIARQWAQVTACPTQLGVVEVVRAAGIKLP